MLPVSLKPLLVEHLKGVKKIHEKDLRDGNGVNRGGRGVQSPIDTL